MVFQGNEESHPDMETDIIEATDIPSVETEVVIFQEPDDDEVRVGKMRSYSSLKLSCSLDFSVYFDKVFSHR